MTFRWRHQYHFLGKLYHEKGDNQQSPVLSRLAIYREQEDRFEAVQLGYLALVYQIRRL